jgi:hypothetical protein
VTDTNVPQKLKPIPYFNITTRGLAIESIRKKPEFVSEEVRKVMASSQSKPSDWNIVMDGVEGSILLIGVMTAARELGCPVRIALDRSFWDFLTGNDFQRIKDDQTPVIACMDPKAVAIEYTPSHD